jgi:hypothetical protein
MRRTRIAKESTNGREASAATERLATPESKTPSREDWAFCLNQLVPERGICGGMAAATNRVEFATKIAEVLAGQGFVQHRTSSDFVPFPGFPGVFALASTPNLRQQKGA